MVLRRKEVYTVITPIPGFIPRQLAIDILHSHGEVITLNPLVLSHKPIKAPRDAASDEYYSTWYEITERIQYIPGIGKLGSGMISFNGCFHDLPWGLQTHIYAPANVDLRNKYRIGGNQPGIEPPEQHEIGLGGLGAPKDGLYLREDIEIRCNFAMVGFVKSQLKTASKEMVDRIIKKAELLDAGILTAMIENGKLKTQNPNDRTYTGGLAASMSPPHSPVSMYHPGHQSQPPPPMSPSMPYQVPRPVSYQVPPSIQQHQQYQNNRPGTAGSQQTGYSYQKQDYPQASELPTRSAQGPPAVVMELPGDFYHSQSSPHLQLPQRSPGFQGSDRASSVSQQSGKSSPGPNDWRWSQSQPSPSLQNSRPTSLSSDHGSAPYASPGLDHKGFASELSTHRETREEHHPQTLQKLDPSSRSQQTYAAYNPADYAKVNR
ncbi:hypothetical protein BJ170DRAFT_433861 [Xylariales sp. AK1849]|nr:hypothetical protein BJ170DRAFT_433861 [Xylariales sp. AK1849]